MNVLSKEVRAMYRDAEKQGKNLYFSHPSSVPHVFRVFGVKTEGGKTFVKVSSFPFERLVQDKGEVFIQ